MAWGGALGCGLGARWRRAILRGRRGTTLHPPSFHVAGVAQTRIYLRFAWQAWHSWHGVARLGVVWARGDAAPFCVAGVAQRYIHLRFTRQAWHKLASTFVSRGRRGAHGMGWRAWVWFGRAVTPRHFAWQAWHNLTSTCVSRGRRGTNSHLPSFRVAGVALMAWGGALGCGLGARWRRAILRGRRGTTLHPLAFHVAGVAQTRIYLRFAWQAWHSWRAWVWFGRAVTPRHFAWQAWHNVTSTFVSFASTFVSRGRRGTHGMGWRAWVWFGRAVTPRHFAWQAWHNLTSTCVSRGRRGTNSHLPSFRVAGVTLMAWVGALGCGLGARRRRAILRGRRRTTLHPPSFHVAASFRVAGVAQTRIYLRFARGTHGMGWRAGCGLGARWRRAILRGRRGTTLHPPSFHVAGVAQIRIYLRFAWQAWHSWHGVARLGVVWARGDAAPFCVAGVAQTDIHLAFAWQAWHSWHGVARLGVVWARGDAAPFCVAERYIHLRFTWQAWHKLTSTLLSRGRRGNHGMGWRAWVRFWRAVTPRHFAWQAWHNLTSTFVSRGRCGTNWHPPCFRVAGVALMAWGGALGPDWSPVTLRLVQEGWQDVQRTAACDSCLFWHVCFLTCLIAFFFWLVSCPITFAARWLSSLWSLRQAGPKCAWSNTAQRRHLCVEFLFLILYPGLLLRHGRVSHGGDNESSSLCPREPGLWPSVGRSVCRCLANRHLCECTYIPTYHFTYIHTYTHTYIHTYIHTYTHTCLPFYIHTYLPTYIPTILPSRSFTTSFVFPSFPVPAKTIEAHFRKKLTCGVIRSFN